MSATDEMLALVDRLAMEMGIGRQGDPTPSLRFTWEQINTIQLIIDQARRDAAAEQRDHADRHEDDQLDGWHAAADLIDPDIEGSDGGGPDDDTCGACKAGGHSCGA
jgi:hypothetical protein